MPTGPSTSDTDRRGRLARICVFCGSSPGRDPAFVAAADELGRTLAERGITVVYGYYDDLFAFFDRTVADGFVRATNREQLYCAPTVPQLLDLLEAHEPRVEPKWIEP